jgi:hypothetical protein
LAQAAVHFARAVRSHDLTGVAHAPLLVASWRVARQLLCVIGNTCPWWARGKEAMSRFKVVLGCAIPMMGSLAIGGCTETDPDTSVDESELVGGTIDADYKYPWAMDIDVSFGGTITKCAGVLVAPTWVLTSRACTGDWSALTVSYQRTNASGMGEGDWTTSVTKYPNGDVMLLSLGAPFADPLHLLVPAAIPSDPGGVGQSGTVVAGHPNFSSVRVSSPNPIIQTSNASTFTATSTGSSLCSQDRGAGLIIPQGGKNVVLGIATSTGDCLSNGQAWTGAHVAPYSQWIHDMTGMWGVFDTWANAPNAKAVSGDFDGDGDADIALAGGDGWGSIPVAFSNGDGTFAITNVAVFQFPGFANAAGAKLAAGDVNADGKDDLIVTGAPGMTTIPVAFSGGTGGFATVNFTTPFIPDWASASTAKVMMGDVDNDGDDDIVLTGGTGWSTIPVGFSNRDGTFTVTNNEVTSFPGLAQASGAKPAATDINGDGKVDIVLTGGSGWTTVPTALSVGNGSFTFSNPTETNIATWSPSSTVKLLGGCRRSIAHPSRPNGHRCDVNNDGRADILLTGGASWSSIPVGYRNANGTMTDTNAVVWAFPTWAQDPNAKVVSGDFNGDHRSDLALVGGTNWWTIPVAYSSTSGAFTVSNKVVD